VRVSETGGQANYAKVTGIDLSTSPFAAAIKHSPEDILELLQEREKTFKEYRNGNRKLISCLRPTVKVIHSFSCILGKAVSLVSCACHSGNPFNVTCQVPFPPTKALFAGIDSVLIHQTSAALVGPPRHLTVLTPTSTSISRVLSILQTLTKVVALLVIVHMGLH
jgi:fungal STAND N-terminal Goodbye domain